MGCFSSKLNKFNSAQIYAERVVSDKKNVNVSEIILSVKLP